MNVFTTSAFISGSIASGSFVTQKVGNVSTPDHLFITFGQSYRHDLFTLAFDHLVHVSDILFGKLVDIVLDLLLNIL